MIRIFKFVLILITLAGMQVSCQEQKADNSSRENQSTNTEAAQAASPDQSTQTILFFGNSLTAGYGLNSTSEAFPALIQQKIDSAGWGYKVINAGLSGETSAGGKDRIGWVLRQPIDVFVLELGANDGLRGIDLATTKQNLQAIIDTVRQKSPEATIILAGMEMPPNMGPDYTARFREIYKDLAQENNTKLIPFLLEGVAGVAQLNQADGIHPTAEGNRIVAENVWKIIAPVLREREA